MAERLKAPREIGMGAEISYKPYNHEYIARDINSSIEFKGEHLRDILKEVRKLIKVPHGQNIRTWLLENEEVIIEGYHRKPKTSDQIKKYRFLITIRKW